MLHLLHESLMCRVPPTAQPHRLSPDDTLRGTSWFSPCALSSVRLAFRRTHGQKAPRWTIVNRVTKFLSVGNRTHRAWFLQLGFLCGFPDSSPVLKLLRSSHCAYCLALHFEASRSAGLLSWQQREDRLYYYFFPVGIRKVICSLVLLWVFIVQIASFSV